MRNLQQLQNESAWIQTYTGKQFHPLAPELHRVSIYDIAHALALQCRYNGHCRRFYSVAEHSVILSRHVPPHMAKEALLHDAAEAYIGDIVRPLKQINKFWSRIEDGIMAVVAQRFGLDMDLLAEVKPYDSALLAAEAEQVMRTPPDGWHLPAPPLEIGPIGFWPPEQAEREFLDRFTELVSARLAGTTLGAA